MNRIGIQFCVALFLSVACCPIEVRAQAQTAPGSRPDLAHQYFGQNESESLYEPPAGHKVAADIPLLPPLSIDKANFGVQDKYLNPPPRKTPVASPETQVDPHVAPVAYAQPFVPPIVQGPYTARKNQAYSQSYAGQDASGQQHAIARANPDLVDNPHLYTESNTLPVQSNVPQVRYVDPNLPIQSAPQTSRRSYGSAQNGQRYSPGMPNTLQQAQPQPQSRLQPQPQSRLQPQPQSRLQPQPQSRLQPTSPIGRKVSWGYPQDEDDPFRELDPADPGNSGSPPVIPPTRRSTQDPLDPFQQLPGNPNEPTARPRLPATEPNPGFVPGQRPQDTDPRPLPNTGSLDPTELPILPRQEDPPQQGTGNQGTGNQGNENQNEDPDKETPFIFPESVVPGKQNYPGATSVFEPNTEPGKATPVDTSQVIYGPSERGKNPNSVLDQYNPGVADSPSLGAYAPPPAGPQIAQANYEVECETCEPPCGWRPELAIGLDSNDPCFTPAFYLSIFGGLNSLDDLSGSRPELGATSSSFSLDNGVGFGFALGQYQGYNLRTEFEYSFRTNDADQLTRTDNIGDSLTLTDFGLNGQVTAHSGMGNIVWQFRDLNTRWVRPYVGAGAGFAFLNANLNRLGQDVLTDGFDGNSTFAYQLFAGLNTQLTRQMDVFLEYRYFATDSLGLETDFNNVDGTSGSFFDEYDYQAHNVFFGVRLKF